MPAPSRGTTVYLVDRRIDMLPKPLTEDICSLRADVDRLAFSVLWEVHDDEAGVRVGRARFTKSIIRSRAAMTYAEAQSRIDDARMQDDITVGLRTLLRIARVLRAARAARGALQLASPEVRFSIDQETHDPTDVSMYQVGLRCVAGDTCVAHWLCVSCTAGCVRCATSCTEHCAVCVCALTIHDGIYAAAGNQPNGRGDDAACQLHCGGAHPAGLSCLCAASPAPDARAKAV